MLQSCLRPVSANVSSPKFSYTFKEGRFSMVDKPSKDPEMTTPSERSAIVTATGIVLSFLLLFAKEWMSYTGDGGWETRDWFFGLPFL
jgi:hypothetical protein